MADDDIRHCPFCDAIFIEDHRMHADPERCPYCGRVLEGGEDALEDDFY